METIMSYTAFALSVISVGFTLFTYFIEQHRQKRQATLDAFNTLQEQVLDNLNLYKKSDIIEIAKDVHSEKYKIVSGYLARLEHFAVGVNTGIYDLNVVRRLAGRYFCGLSDKISPMIQKKRRVNTSEKHYDELDIMIDKIKKQYK